MYLFQISLKHITTADSDHLHYDPPYAEFPEFTVYVS